VPIRIETSPAASEELDVAVDYVLRISRAAADRFADSYERAITNILEFPFIGREEFGARRLQITGSDYAIIYRVREDGSVTIVAFPHASREPGYWRDRL
jgi:plasmid stabilization system protein ParE